MAKVLEILGKNVAYWRHKRGWTQKELADRAVVGLYVVQRMEGGKTWPEAENISKIAIALGAEETDLFYPGKPPEIPSIPPMPPPQPPNSKLCLRLIRDLLLAIEKQNSEFLRQFLKDWK